MLLTDAGLQQLETKNVGDQFEPFLPFDRYLVTYIAKLSLTLVNYTV